MSIIGGPNISTNGLIYLLDPTQFDGTSTDVILNKPADSNWTLYNYATGNSSYLTTIQSNCESNGAGNSFITISRNAQLETGSITFQIWFNLENIPLKVGANNNWRGFLCTSNSGVAGSPLTTTLEQSYQMNFSTTHAGVYRRFLNNSFTPLTANTTGWQMITYTYDQATGNAAAYKNDILFVSGPMTADAANGNPTTAGTGFTYTNYQSSGFRIYGGTITTADPNGNGIVPGEVGNILFYNRALSQSEIIQNYNALRGRYGI